MRGDFAPVIIYPKPNIMYHIIIENRNGVEDNEMSKMW